MKNGVNEIMEQAKKVHGARKSTIAKKKAIRLGALVVVDKVTTYGIKKIFGLVYDFNKDKSKVWVESTEDIHVADLKEVKVLKAKAKKQPTKGFNHHKTKLHANAVKDIYTMAHSTEMTHPQLVSWVFMHYGIEIVPKTISDIKLGKRWAKLTSTIQVKGAY